MTLQTWIQSGKPVAADGGMGTMLFNLGLERGESPELWTLDFPDRIAGVHRAYIDAGAQIILTNTFGGSRLRLESHGLGERAREINEAAARLARRVVAESGREVLVAGDMGPCGQFFEPMGTLSYDDAVTGFAAQVEGLAAGGVDLLWIETMSDLEEVRAAIDACKQVAPDLPIIVTMTFDTRGRTMMGVTPERAAKTLAEMGTAAIGANCGNGPQELIAAIEKMRAAQPDVVLVAKANAGLPRVEAGRTIYDATPEQMGDYAREVYARGARIIGACCGSTPAHVQAIAAALHELGQPQA